MCGIAGFLNLGNNHQKTEKEKYEILRKMNEAQRHRAIEKIPFNSSI